MQQLTRVTHEHHDRLWHYINQLDELADCLNPDCLDSGRLRDRMPELRELHRNLRDSLLPHMEAVEFAVYPTIERLLAASGKTTPMIAEHTEIRRMIAQIGEFADNPEAHGDRAAVLGLRRVALRLYALLKAHLSEEELYIPILEDTLTPSQEASLARALDHVAAERL
jgi:iron-sulfur cluster repair protein YtfE (RIC family)